MAKVSLVRPPSGPRLFYNVDGAVGRGALNKRDDVLLVQYFLQVAFDEIPPFQAEPFPGDLEVTGTPDQDTFDAILHFQKVMKKRGSTIATDGRIDPPSGEDVRGSISHTQYTIIFLNQAYEKARPDQWPHVAKASDCPGELRPLLIEPTFV
jgi:hypothetical protein